LLEVCVITIRKRKGHHIINECVGCQGTFGNRPLNAGAFSTVLKQTLGKRLVLKKFRANASQRQWQHHFVALDFGGNQL